MTGRAGACRPPTDADGLLGRLSFLIAAIFVYALVGW